MVQIQLTTSVRIRGRNIVRKSFRKAVEGNGPRISVSRMKQSKERKASEGLLMVMAGVRRLRKDLGCFVLKDRLRVRIWK